MAQGTISSASALSCPINTGCHSLANTLLFHFSFCASHSSLGRYQLSRHLGTPSSGSCQCEASSLPILGRLQLALGTFFVFDEAELIAVCNSGLPSSRRSVWSTSLEADKVLAYQPSHIPSTFQPPLLSKARAGTQGRWRQLFWRLDGFQSILLLAFLAD